VVVVLSDPALGHLRFGAARANFELFSSCEKEEGLLVERAAPLTNGIYGRYPYGGKRGEVLSASCNRPTGPV